MLLCFGVGKSQEELDAVVVCEDTVEILDDSFSDFSGFKSVCVSYVQCSGILVHTEQSRLPC